MLFSIIIKFSIVSSRFRRKTELYFARNIRVILILSGPKLYLVTKLLREAQVNLQQDQAPPHISALSKHYFVNHHVTILEP